MRILLTNDDGIFAPGIIAMHDELQRNHDVTVVAPANVQSGGSHAITIRNPVLWRPVSCCLLLCYLSRWGALLHLPL